MTEKSVKILLCCTGSVATIKLMDILSLMDKNAANFELGVLKCETKVIFTEKAKHFCPMKNSWPYPDVQVYSDDDEWSSWQQRGDPVLHIDLTKWADILLIAPLDANTMAKIANGVCDNMLTCAVRAWPLDKPLVFCPAMNTKMWEHPITATQIGILKSWGYIEIPCIAKTLMCGDTGLGAMAEPKDIVSALLKLAYSVAVKNNEY